MCGCGKEEEFEVPDDVWHKSPITTVFFVFFGLVSDEACGCGLRLGESPAHTGFESIGILSGADANFYAEGVAVLSGRRACKFAGTWSTLGLIKWHFLAISIALSDFTVGRTLYK